MITTTLTDKKFDLLLSVLDDDQDERIIALRDDLLRQRENQRIHIIALENELINHPSSTN
jgi:hypothetical protein